jgi:hypothetical protein
MAQMRSKNVDEIDSRCERSSQFVEVETMTVPHQEPTTYSISKSLRKMLNVKKIFMS